MLHHLRTATIAAMTYCLGAATYADLPAPESLPRLTVRWEDPGKREVFVVEGARYQCRVGTWPAKILSLRVDGVDLLGPEGLEFQVLAADGARLRPAPRGLTPNWKVWRGRQWRPATDGRARLNVWNAGIWYWDAHLLDIPLIPARIADALSAPAVPSEPAVEWTFQDGPGDWEGLHNCEIVPTGTGTVLFRPTGDDPYAQSPPVAVPGPVIVELRARTQAGGGAAFYWTTTDAPAYTADRNVMVTLPGDGEWHTVRASLPVRGVLQRLRFDPPGDDAPTEVAALRLYRTPNAGMSEADVLRGELVFHAFRDQLRIEFRCTTPKDRAAPTTFVWYGPDADYTGQERVEDRALAILGTPPRGAWVLAPPGGRFDPDSQSAEAPLSGAPARTWWVVRAVPADETPDAAFIDDVTPLTSADVHVRNGHWLGWDAPAGLYEVGAVHAPGAYLFNTAYDVPNRRMEIDLTIRSAAPRRIMMRSRSYSGILPATVLTDPAGFMLPTPVQSCKNFGGEREEPDDSSYGDAYFPVTVPPDREQRFRIVHLFQRWGDHMLKQVTSIRFFHIYWHLSTGISETTCFTIPHFPLNGVYVRIPDFRPYSGPFWVGQPQHSCLTWPGLLQYRSDGKNVRLMYDETRFYSIAPNLARFTMFFHTSDDAAVAAATVMEVPQSDELRTFLRLRYEWKQAAIIEGDARSNFRWLNINDKAIPELLLWTDAKSRFQTLAVEANGKPMLEAVPLAPRFPVAGSHKIHGGRGERYGSFVLVRSFRARLGGRTLDQPHLSARYGKRSGNYWFCAPGKKLELQPGDFIEADVMLMPHGDPVEPLLKPERERIRYGVEGPVIQEVKIGRKIADFPATVAADDDVVRCTLAGGHNALPLIVTNVSAPGVPLLWENGAWLNQQCHGGDGYQVNPDGKGRRRWIFVIPLRHGMKPQIMVTRAECSTGIRRVHDLNGFPCLESGRTGRFRLRAPMLFAPGRNEITRDVPVHRFEGEAQRVRAAPVTVIPAGETVRATIREWTEDRVDLTVDAAATITFGEPADKHRYAVTVNGKQTIMRAQGRRITLRTEGPAEIRVAIVSAAPPG